MNPTSQLQEKIIKTIYVIRGRKVILDFDLANLYGVETRRLNEQVKRNAERFPEDFIFQLSQDEFQILKSQFATSRSGWGGRRKPPYVYTEYGALQAANVLRSEEAAKMSIFIVKAFLHLREILRTNDDIAKKIEALEKRLGDHDKVLKGLVQEVKSLLEAPKPKDKKGKIGFILPDSIGK